MAISFWKIIFIWSGFKPVWCKSLQIQLSNKSTLCWSFKLQKYENRIVLSILTQSKNTDFLFYSRVLQHQQERVKE